MPFDEIADARRPDAGRGPPARQPRAPAPDPGGGARTRTPTSPSSAGSSTRSWRPSRAGDFEALLRVLDPDVVLRSDGGGTGPLARPPVSAPQPSRRQLAVTGPRFAALARPVIVNGAAGVVVEGPGQPRVVVAFTVRRGRIVSIDLIGDPAKLGGLDLG